MPSSGEQAWVRFVALGAIALLAIVIGIAPVLAPRGEPVDGFTEAATAHVAEIAQAPHPMGSAENERVRSYLLGTLSEIGLLPETQSVEAPDYFGAPGGIIEVVNVLARIEGTAGTDDAILLMAHYDTVDSTAGANDNSAAVAGLLEVARGLTVEPGPHDVIVLFTDGEEPTPRFGATAFVDQHPWASDVRLVANFEGIGQAGPGLLVELQGPADEMVGMLGTDVTRPVAFSFLTETADLIGGAASDMDVFHDRGTPGYNLAFLRGSSIYHTMRDDIASLNTSGMAHNGAYAAAIARMDDLPLPDDGQPVVFFTLPFGVVVLMPSWVIHAALGVGIGLVAWGVMRRRRAGTSFRAIAAGCGWSAAAVLGGALVGTVLWTVIAGVRSTMGYVEAYIWLLGLIAIVCGCWYLVSRRMHRSGADLVDGVLLVWLIVAVLLGLTVPGIGYLVVLPFLVGAAVSVVGGVRDRWLSYPFTGSVAVVAAAILVPAIDSYFLISGPRPGNPDSELPWVVFLPLLFASMAIGLVMAADQNGNQGAVRDVS